MIHKKGNFNSGNDELFYQTWLPEGDVKAIVIVIHGGGDHSGRFSNLVEHIVPEGFATYIPDLRGHGQSPGKRGHIEDWEEYRRDLSTFLNFVHSQNPGHPLMLFGHSMGGVIVLDYCLRKQDHITAVIVTSPAIGKLGISPILFQLAKVLNKIWPSLVLPTGLIVQHLSRDKNFNDKTKADPLYHSKSTPRFGIEMVKTVEFIHQNSESFCLPIYLIHGTGDLIASVEGSRKFRSNVSQDIITYKEYEGGFHELVNDLGKEKILEEMTSWIKKYGI